MRLRGTSPAGAVAAAGAAALLFSARVRRLAVTPGRRGYFAGALSFGGAGRIVTLSRATSTVPSIRFPFST